MVKRSCEKHEKFNYYCEDCQEVNRKYEVQQQVKNLERGNIAKIEGSGKPPTRKSLVASVFQKIPRFKKYLKILLPTVVIILVILSIFWFWPAWFGPINLNAQLYENKAGGLNYYEFYFLNFWSINFFFNKTALIGAITGCIIMSLPPNQNLLTIIGTRLRFGKPSRLKSLIFWWTGGFVLFYLIGMLLDFDGQFSWVMYLYEKGAITLSPFTLFTDAFDVLLNPNNTNIEFIFIYSRLYLPLIYYILGILIFRMVLNIASNFYLKRNDYNIISNALMIIGSFCGIIFFSLPSFALNGIQLLQMWSLVIAFIGLIGLGISVYIYGRIKLKRNPKNYVILKPQRIKMGIIAGVLIFLITLPALTSIGPAVTISNTSVYSQYEWTQKINREISWTRACAGLDMIEERSIENFTLSSDPLNDTQMISQIRQFDQDFAVQSLAAKIGTTFEGLADSDIVYIDGTEYWVAPKSIRLSQFSGDPVKTNTELYDHIEGFLAMDTFTGELVNISSIFNISEDYPIFFGESESKKFLEQQNSKPGLGAYDESILLDTGWRGGIPNNKYVYEGEPDGVLKGLEAFWYTVNLGLWGYVFEGGEYSYLINRNVKSRVRKILLPQLSIDYDPYLVFDSYNNKMYYAVSIFTSINIGSYSRSPILRFLGICLVDVKNGEMVMYKNPSLIESTIDSTYSLWKHYMDAYDWQDIPTWLKFQLRYPENLFELQLEANYKYHVQDLKKWKRGDDFHERPENGDLFYIETNLGDGIEFIGLDLVEYKGTEARTLAGMYVIRHGDNFGEAIFYHTRNSTENLIGPKTARDTYVTEATQEITLIAGARNGNTLIYPLGGTVYYYIPTYSSVGGLQQLKLAGFVNAFTRQVGYGSEAFEAYDSLENFAPRPFILSSDADNPDIDGSFILNWTESELAESYSIYRNNSLLIGNLPSSQTTYPIFDITSGTYEFLVKASNEFGNTTSNILTIIVKIFAISFDFNMDNSMTLPNDLAGFRIELENFNESVSAPGYNIKVNLSLYREDGGDFSILVPPYLYPIENYTFDTGTLSGINFTLIDDILFSGEGLILNGFVNCTEQHIIILFKWTLIVNDIVIYRSSEDFISVL
ncbi:MAG: hypothetical protein CEE43_06410 [Promethearchaeota archaeon Loki_b32]|nr:MAG: hypothetical protein CEE43_06410 [Candidatus Lokiarchaeota archaeon Loki_b32]